MNNVLTTIAAILILVLTALFTIPLLINWDDYRSDFEVRLAEIMGAKVELDGRLNVRLLPTPFVSAENLRIGESGKSGKPVLEVKELTLWVAVPPLLKGVIEASRVTLEQPQLVLEFDKKGRPVFDDGKRGQHKKAASKGRAKQVKVQEAALSGFQLSPNLISLRNVQIKNGSVSLKAPSTQAQSKKRKGKEASGNLYQMRSLKFEGIDGVLSAITLTGPFYFNGKYFTDAETERRPNFVRLSIGELSKASSTKKEAHQAIFPVQGKVRTPAIDRVVEFDGRVGAKGGAWFAKGALKASLGKIGSRVGAQVQKAQLEQGSLKTVSVETTHTEALGQREASGGELTPQEKQEKALKLAEAITKSATEETVYFTSQLHVVSHRADITNILIRTGSVARPQTIKGQVQIDWKKDLRLSGRADGQVIDLNQILLASVSNSHTQRQTTVAPAVGLGQLNDLLLTQANVFDSIYFEAKVSQVFLGKGDVRDFGLELKGRDGRIRIEKLEGRMAGNTRLSVSGDFSQEGEHPLFQGGLYLRGLQFQEFLRWAVPSYKGEHKLGRGKYMLSGELFSKGETVRLSDLQARLGQSSLRGDLTYLKNKQKGQASSLRVSLRSGPIAIEDLFGQEISLNDLETEFSQIFKTNKLGLQEADKIIVGGANKVAGAHLTTLLDLTAQRVVFKDSVQKDVRFVWRDDEHGSYIDRLSGVSAEGLRLSYENGKADALGEDKFFIEVLNEKALNQLLQFAGLEEARQISQTVGQKFYPLQFGVRREVLDEHTHYRFDGQAGGSDTAFSVFIPLEGAERKAGVLTILGGMESENGALLASKFLPLSIDPQLSADRFGTAKVSFTASGTVENGFRGQVNLANRFMKATYDGQFAFKDSEFASDGEVLISGPKARDVLSLFGFERFAKDGRLQSDGGAFRAQGQFSKVQSGFALSDLRIAAGERTMIGTGLFIKREGQGTVRLALATSKLDLQTLVGGLQQHEKKVTSQTDGTKAGSLKSVWSDVPFQLKESEAERSETAARVSEAPMLGDFSIRANELQLSQKLSLSDAEVRWRVHPTYIEILEIKGKSLGGEFKASGTLRERGDKYSLNGTAALEKARLDEIGAAEEAIIGSGEFSFNLSLSGEGKSPKQLVSNLIGEGFLKISDGSLRQVSPLYLSQVAERYLKSKTGDAEQLRADLALVGEKVKPLKISSLDLGLRMLDGAVKVRQKDFGIRPGRIGLEAELKLTDLSWFGNWTIEPQARKSIGKVPGVTRKIQGDFQSLAGLKSQLDVNELERYLTLKHKERELRILEKNRLDQEARRLAEERRLTEEKLERIRQEKARLKREQEALDQELNRTELPALQ